MTTQTKENKITQNLMDLLKARRASNESFSKSIIIISLTSTSPPSVNLTHSDTTLARVGATSTINPAEIFATWMITITSGVVMDFDTPMVGSDDSYMVQIKSTDVDI